MNTKRLSLRTAANWAMGLGLVAVMLFSAVTPAYAGGGIFVASVSVGGPSGPATYGVPGDVSYVVTVVCDGSGGGATWSPTISSVLPAGVTPSFSPTPLSWPNNCGSTVAGKTKTTTLTLHTTSASPAGVTNFNVAVDTATGPGALTIHPVQLTVTGFVPGNKVYNNDTNGSISTPGTLVGAPAGITLELGSAGATFSQKNVGINILVNAFGYGLQGTGATNYTVVQPQGYANITPKTLHVFMSSTQDKVYDGTVNAVVSLSTDAYPSDGIVASGAGTFDTRDVGNSKTVTVPSVALSGPGAGNYTPDATTASGTANITKRSITVNAVVDSKQYDGSNTSSATPSISGSLGTGDTSGFSQTFDSKNVGTSKVLTPAGNVNDANGGNNYSVTFATNSSGSISARPLTVSANGVNKAYNGTNAATVVLSDNKVFGDAVNDHYTNATFGDKNVGTGKAVSVTGITIDGADSGNYSLSNSSASTTADITERAITVGASTNTKIYDGNASASALPTVIGGTLAPGDALNFTESYADKNVGSGKTLSPSGFVSDGNAGKNYAVTLSNDTTGVINAKPVVSVTPDNKSMFDNEALPEFTFQYSAGDILSGDVISTPPVCSAAVPTPLVAGEYDITCSRPGDPNYDFSATSLNTGKLTVNSSGSAILSTDPATLYNFGYQLAGTSGLPKAFVVSNSGSLDLHVTDVSLSGTAFNLLTTGVDSCYSGSWAFTLVPGASCKVYVQFYPAIVSAPSGNLSIDSSDGGSASIALTGNGGAGTQILKNGGFDIDANLNGVPDTWTKRGIWVAPDGMDCTIKYAGKCSLTFDGNNKAIGAQQVLKKSGSAGAGFYFVLRSKSLNVPASAVYDVRILLYNGTTLVGTSPVMSFNKGTHAFQLVKGYYTAPADFTKIIFRITFKASAGNVWFDGGALKW